MNLIFKKEESIWDTLNTINRLKITYANEILREQQKIKRVSKNTVVYNILRLKMENLIEETYSDKRHIKRLKITKKGSNYLKRRNALISSGNENCI